jgi:hypothetical protein
MKVLRYPGTPQAIVLRCRVVLGAAEGTANNELARQLSTSLPTVLLWRRRFLQQGVLGILEDKPRPGRPRSITPAKEVMPGNPISHSELCSHQWLAIAHGRNTHTADLLQFPKMLVCDLTATDDSNP